MEKFAPCIEKGCSYYCNPVKVKPPFSQDKIPKDKNGEKLWNTEGLLVSDDCPDGGKIKTHDCKNFIIRQDYARITKIDQKYVKIRVVSGMALINQLMNNTMKL